METSREEMYRNVELHDREEFESRRERNNKISSLMGDYLLKGYTMLGTCCKVCGTILLRDRQQKEYCVACVEIDGNLMQVSNQNSNEPSNAVAAVDLLSTTTGHATSSPAISYTEIKPLSSTGQHIVMGTESSVISQAVEAVYEKMAWATNHLSSCTSVGQSIELLELIKTCASTLHALQKK